MNITLIDPLGSTRGLNVGLAYLAAATMAKGHKTHVVDFNNYRDNIDARVRKIKADIAGFSLKSATVGMSDAVIKAVMENKDVRYRICGGSHIAVDGLEFMNAFAFDAAFMGESEETLVQYAEYLEGKREVGLIGNVIVRDKSGDIIHRAPGMERIADLDTLAFPAYEVFDSFDGTIPNYPLVTSRGCPYDCIYCCVPEVSGRKWRARSVGSVVEELIRARAKYASRHFHIIDDNFTLNMNRAKEFCQTLLSREVGMTWSCPNGVRADRLDAELLELMKRSGCESINIGVESGVQRVFTQLKKGETLGDIEATVKAAKKVGLKVNGFFIIGIPGSSYSDDMASLRYSEELGIDDALFNLLSIYPGTELWDIIKNNKDVRLLKDWTDAFHFGGAETVFDTPGYTSEERMRAFYVANLRRRHYLVVVGEMGSPIAMVFRLARIIWKYDRQNIFDHVKYLVANIKMVIGVLR